jgi:NAD(P)-dependent dehydrogenase (short-subunit alcohol dehydrogenase family)
MKYNDLFSIKQKIVLITGSSSGIGAEIAKGFIENSAQVIGLSRSVPEKEIKFKDFFKCEITDNIDIEKKIDLIKKKYNKIDVLINVVGTTIDKSFFENEMERFDLTFNTNIRAVYKIINSLIPNMSANSSIINFSSIGSYLGFPNNPSYCASKAAVSGLSRALANDLGKKNIRVNCIVPGYFHTKMTHNSFTNKEKKIAREKRTILGRWGDPTELVGPSLFLASDASSYITGTDLIVDGGWLSKGL